MAPHYSILAWEISWTEESGRLQSMGSQRAHQAPPSMGYSRQEYWSEVHCLLQLETEGKAILVIKWQRTWLNCSHVLVFCGR